MATICGALALWMLPMAAAQDRGAGAANRDVNQGRWVATGGVYGHASVPTAELNRGLDHGIRP